MLIINKHFWKIGAGFLGIVILGIGTLVVFEYWRDYKAEEELKTLIKETDQKGAENYRQISTSTPNLPR